MGCCLTTTAATNNFEIHSKTRDTSPPMPPGSGEETVKEILSETPKKPPPTNSIPSKITPTTLQFHSEDEFMSKDVVDVQMTKHPIEKNASEVSSEVYSNSSAATTTTLGTGIDIDAQGDEVNKPPPVKKVSTRQPTPCSLQQFRRPPSPARRPVVRSTDKDPQLKSRTAQRKRNVVSSNVAEHKPALRQSRTPALRMEVRQLTVNNSGKRVPLNVRKNEVNVKVKKANDPVPEPETSESLENPFVSLECFIFL